ncbi:MAG: hypothetical protein CM1200mP18_16220 [Gammaproteobacteria bacterium]|nr:MAG: hypothetical protein CM1200mP18_16220 [Gammaproteobacteria bacterium]
MAPDFQSHPDSAAKAADLREGDVITMVNGRAIKGATELRNVIGLARADEEIELTYIRDRKSFNKKIRIRAVVAESGRGIQISESFEGLVWRTSTTAAVRTANPA